MTSSGGCEVLSALLWGVGRFESAQAAADRSRETGAVPWAGAIHE